jgi:outer membrane protein assembly factor BamB
MPTHVQGPEKIRLWPGVLIIGSYWALRIGGRIGPLSQFLNPLPTFVIVAAALALLVWWLFFSRLRWSERMLGLSVLVIGGAAAVVLAHNSMHRIHRDGIVGLMAPFVATVALASLVVFRRASPKVRDVGFAGLVLGVWGSVLLVRVVDGSTELKWRWTPTAEEKFLEQQSVAKKASAKPIGPLVVRSHDWPQFRGPNRENVVGGVRLETDWEKYPPKLQWKQRIGPGWSSFAVVDNVCFTQEQRGEDEATVCYRIDTGAEVWSRLDRGRFWEAAAGAGPRGTPTFHEGKIYAAGATGLVNCLDATTGQLLWQRNITKDADVKIPDWGFAASPLVVADKVVLFAGGGEGKGTIAYDAAHGDIAWLGGTGTHSFSSAQLAHVAGIEQILMAHDLGLDALAPDDGKTLWHHDWNMQGHARVVQPYVFGNDRVVLASGYGEGSRLLKVSHQDDAWQTETVWTSKRLVPYYNDFVVQDDHAYGFDGNIFCCIDLQTGERKWKKGRYGYGQVLLLADQKMLLILSDDGTAVLVAAEPAALREVSRFKIIEGKTWNHPVLVHGKLLVRNSEEAACCELTLQ